MRLVLLAAATAAAVVLAGCGSGEVPRGRVHGTIKYGGKPLSGVTMVLIAKDNKTHAVDLKSDGTYEVSGVAVGPVKVSLQPVTARVAVKGEFDPPPAPSAAKGVSDEKAGKSQAPTGSKAATQGGGRLPEHYSNPEKSGLTFELKGPDQEWSVDLK